MKLSYKKAFWIVFGIVLVCVSALVSVTLFRNAAKPLSKDVSQTLSFSPLVPDRNSGLKPSNTTLSRTEDGTQLLSYSLVVDTIKLAVSENVQPSQFDEVPEYKNRFLTNVINQYATIQTAGGTIYLGRSEKQNNKQIALILDKGLMVFLNPESELTDQQWRTVGDSLVVDKTIR